MNERLTAEIVEHLCRVISQQAELIDELYKIAKQHTDISALESRIERLKGEYI